jgi:hypothetical protein
MELGVHLADCTSIDIVDIALADSAGFAAKDTPRHVGMAFGFVGDDAISQNALRLHHANATPEATSAGATSSRNS